MELRFADRLEFAYPRLVDECYYVHDQSAVANRIVSSDFPLVDRARA